METKKSIVIELTVRNHPGVMSQLTGLFARRAFNLEGILCTSNDYDRSKSAVFLLVDWNEKFEQVVRQLEKLYDVLEIAIREDCDHAVFRRLDKFLHDKAFVEKKGEAYAGIF